MTMTHDHLHTHGPDELTNLRAECDKWHKAYDRVWEERMRFADRAIELEKENKTLSDDVADKIESITELQEVFEKYKTEIAELNKSIDIREKVLTG